MSEQDKKANARGPVVSVYMSEAEREALDMLAQLENRSSSNLIRVELVKVLKNRGLLYEKFGENGELEQVVVKGGAVVV